uniref:SLC41A/MgtE integral membrane domain-containing protein n=1 Tax=Phaeomonas parva TaxID=124430 RepID=A0A7S1XKX0_9STRA|mmetsp:Transcript_17627/g.53970  ORF Transcript_17627/g.53970 Transcript_17627/m.53970 type:complete len:395 (+) Transcript_17627:55-1239(+)
MRIALLALALVAGQPAAGLGLRWRSLRRRPGPPRWRLFAPPQKGKPRPSLRAVSDPDMLENFGNFKDVARLPLDAEGEFCHTIPADFRVDETIAALRNEQRHKDDGFEGRDPLLVVEADGRLWGELSCYELLTTEGNATMREFAREPDVVLLEHQVKRGDEMAILELLETEAQLAPIVDDEGRLTRVMTAEDALMALTDGFEPQDADAEEPELEGYFSTTLLDSILARSRWLLSLLMLQSLSSVILKMYEDTLSSHFVLALFLTMITGTAGNAGNQSTSLIIRGLATGEIGKKQVLSVLLREFWAGVSMGGVLGVAAFFRVMACPGAKAVDALVVALSLAVVVVAGVVMGAGAPLLLRRLGVDPANSASPMLATLMDITGVLVLCVAGKYFLSA